MEGLLRKRIALFIAVAQMFCCLSLARAGDDRYGDLDFSRLSIDQEQLFWRRLNILAFEDATVAYCGDHREYEKLAIEGVERCVTADALRRADSFFRVRLRTFRGELVRQRWACTGTVRFNGVTDNDAATLVDNHRRNLDNVVSEITDLCDRCRNSIWAIFCH
jgi:hypothetical protein